MPVINQTPSNLTTGQISFGGEIMTSDEFRNKISRVNGYTEFRQYGNDFMNSNKVANAAFSVLNVIPQFNALGGLGSTLGRGVAAATGNLSPLEKTATIMLGKQMFYNSVSHLSQQFVPSVNILGPFTGGKLFNFPVDYSITKNANQGLLGKIVSTAFFKTTSVPDAFRNNPTTEDFLSNTGKAQLSFFYDAINQNVYKQVDTKYGENDLLTKYAGAEFADIKGGIKTQYESLVDTFGVNNNAYMEYFNFDNKDYHQYLKNATKYSPSSVVVNSNSRMSDSFITTNSVTQQYAPDDDFIVNFFGNTNKTTPTSLNSIEDYVNNRKEDDISNQLIWGRDGIDYNARKSLDSLHGDTVDEQINLQQISSTLNAEYKVKAGLLEYTRNLLNATSGHYVDMTRKVFEEGGTIVGFNGSPLWKANNSVYAQASSINGITGTRQHSILDPYDKFAKAIRFNGNVAYNGNPNSVVHQSVMPRIHPTLNNLSIENDINNKNLMFSIENLAVKTIIKDNYGIINDEWGSPIPMSEVGPFRGRIMWFAPYDLQVNETASAKYESTVMVGRSEPMYNYMNSERSATLSFTLLMDYPPHVRNFGNKNNSKKDISDFFAFGGDPLPTEAVISELELRIQNLKLELSLLNVGEIPLNPDPDPNLSEEILSIYFPNDMPKAGQSDDIIDTMYKDYQYEIIDGLDSGKDGGDGNGFGLNKLVYYLTGLTKSGNEYTLSVPAGFSQYNVIKTSSDFGNCKLNEILIKFFSNVENRKLYTISIEGSASKLYQGTDAESYNLELSKRRIQATKTLIVGRLMAMFPDTNATDYIWDTSKANGSSNASDLGSNPDNIHDKTVKEERSATIRITRNSNTLEPKEGTSNTADVEAARKLRGEIASLETLLSRLKKISPENVNDYLFNERRKESKAMLRSDEAIVENYYVPALHSQTPEEFHRRLTFLQQCTRQGSAKATNMTEDNGILRAKNSVFGRQPICILRVGDFFYTKVIIESVTVDYNDSPWDMNPEGFGMQPMMAKVTLQMKLIGGQSLKGPIDILQNAVSFNYYANSTFSDVGMYARPAINANKQEAYMKGVIENSDKSWKFKDGFKPITNANNV